MSIGLGAGGTASGRPGAFGLGRLLVSPRVLLGALLGDAGWIALRMLLFQPADDFVPACPGRGRGELRGPCPLVGREVRLALVFELTGALF